MAPVNGHCMQMREKNTLQQQTAVTTIAPKVVRRLISSMVETRADKVWSAKWHHRMLTCLGLAIATYVHMIVSQ